VARDGIVKILIAGASGQLGRCLQIALNRHDVIALDRRALDISHLSLVREAVAAYRPAMVINAAAFNDVDGADSRSADAYAVNALGPRNLAVATAAKGIPLLHISTDYVFDGVATRPYHEFDRPNPLSGYGASKLAGEKAIQSLNARHFIVRTAWLFWENGANFLRSMHSRSSQPELRAVSDQYGSPTYVPHLSAAITDSSRPSPTVPSISREVALPPDGSWYANFFMFRASEPRLFPFHIGNFRRWRSARTTAFSRPSRIPESNYPHGRTGSLNSPSTPRPGVD
jgi:dTDP-4-dehydrorhamnose reductase